MTATQDGSATPTLGRTRFGDVGEVTKHDIRLTAFGACEEANGAVGTALAFGDLDNEVAATLTSVQNDLFDAMADLSAPMDEVAADSTPVRITEEHIAWVDRAVEHYTAGLEPIEGYVIPGGTIPATLLFTARTSVRRAERANLAAVAEHPRSMSPLVSRYLNSVSSLLFVLARLHNTELGDTVWQPLASIATSRSE